MKETEGKMGRDVPFCAHSGVGYEQAAACDGVLLSRGGQRRLLSRWPSLISASVSRVQDAELLAPEKQ